MTTSPLGFSIDALTLPNEDPSEHRRLYNEWMSAYPNSDPIVQGLILQAVMALIETRRVERIRATVRTDKIRTADLFWERRQEDTVERYLQRFNFHAPSALVGLLRSAAGCRWAIAFLERLQKLLIDDGTWYGIDKIGAIQIQGFSARISELFYEEKAYITWLDCLAAQPNPKQADIDRILDPVNVPKALLDRDVVLWPRDPAESRARLQAMLDRELPRIKAIEATLRVQYETPSRAEAQTAALAEVTKDEMQLLRSQRIHEQSYQQAVTALLKVRKQPARPRVPAAKEIDPALLKLRPRDTAPGARPVDEAREGVPEAMCGAGNPPALPHKGPQGGEGVIRRQPLTPDPDAPL